MVWGEFIYIAGSSIPSQPPVEYLDDNTNQLSYLEPRMEHRRNSNYLYNWKYLQTSVWKNLGE